MLPKIPLFQVEPASNVYGNAVNYFLGRTLVAPSTEHLSILPMASNEFAMDQDSMPSWVSGWDKNTGSPPMFTGSSLRCRWAASKGKRAVLVETDDRTRPILQGLRISTIAEFVRNPESQYRNILFAMELWDARVSKLNSYYNDYRGI